MQLIGRTASMPGTLWGLNHYILVTDVLSRGGPLAWGPQTNATFLPFHSGSHEPGPKPPLFIPWEQIFHSTVSSLLVTWKDVHERCVSQLFLTATKYLRETNQQEISFVLVHGFRVLVPAYLASLLWPAVHPSGMATVTCCGRGSIKEIEEVKGSGNKIWEQSVVQ